jgi:hypothetical protein
MTYPERGSVLKRKMETEENLVSIKRGDIRFHTLIYGDRRIILN